MALRKVALERRDDGTWPEPEGELVETLSVGTEVLRVLVRCEQPDPDPLFDPTEYSVSGLRDELREYDLTDEEREAMLDLERNGDDRTTAITAIENA